MTRCWKIFIGHYLPNRAHRSSCCIGLPVTVQRGKSTKKGEGEVGSLFGVVVWWGSSPEWLVDGELREEERWRGKLSICGTHCMREEGDHWIRYRAARRGSGWHLFGWDDAVTGQTQWTPRFSKTAGRIGLHAERRWHESSVRGLQRTGR